MNDRMTIGQMVSGIPSVHPKRPGPAKTDYQPTANGKTFDAVLQDKLLTFSHHAEIRMKQRGLELAPAQMKQLHQAIIKAESKGAKESLVLFQDMALIVNIKNKTVVTAMDSQGMKDNVFTQIDSAIIVS